MTAKWISNEKIKCKSPNFGIADIESDIQFEAKIQISNNDGIDWSDDYILITYRNDLLMQIDSISPLYAPSSGTQISVHGKNFNSDTQIACDFGDAKLQTIATVVSDVLLHCQAPSVNKVMSERRRLIDLSISNFSLVTEEEGITSSNISFTYVQSPQLQIIHPTEGPWSPSNGSMGQIKITGTNMPTLLVLTVICRWQRVFLSDDTLDYRVDSYTYSNATVINETELLCDLPEPTEKVESYFGVEISFNEQDYTQNNLMYRYFEPIELEQILPSIVPNISSEITVEITANYVPFWREFSCWYEDDESNRVNVTRINRWIFWCTLPTINAPSIVSLCAGIFGSSYDCINLTVIESAEMYSVEPNFGLIHGHTPVTIKGERFYDDPNGIYVKMFNADYNFSAFVPATFIDSNTVECLTHSVTHPGVYQMSLYLNSKPFTTSYLNYSYTAHSKILSVEPYNVISTGGTVLDIFGQDFDIAPAQNVVFCTLFFDGIEYYKVRGSVLSDTNATCTLPDLSSYLIESDVEIIFVALTFNNHSKSLLPQPLHIVPPLSFNYTNPINVQLYHVTPIFITGTNLGYDRFVNVSELLYCRWNESIFTKASYANLTTIQCNTPNFTNDAVNELTLTFNLQQYSEPIYIRSFTEIVLLGAIPDNVPDEGGTWINIHGIGFIESDYLRCQYDDGSTEPAIFVNSSIVQCKIPSNINGELRNKSILISNNGINYSGDINGDPVFVEYLTPRLYFVDPPNGPAFGGTVLTAQGHNFKNTQQMHIFMICDQKDVQTQDYIQAKIVPFDYVNSTFMLLHSPEVEVDTAQRITSCSLEITNNGMDYSRNGAVYSYYTLFIESFLPISGSTDGGTEIVVTGFGFKDRPELSCLFGGHVTTSATLLRPEQLKCATPPFSSIYPNFNYSQPNALPFNVTLEVTNNLIDFTSQQMTFIYEMRPSIISISPSFVIGNSLTEVTVHLNNSNNYVFTDYDGIGGHSGTFCNFDGIVSEGQIINNHTLLCTSPPLASGTNTSVSVANNMQDFSTDNVIFQSINLTEGYYANHTIEVICPKGSFCPSSTSDQEMGIEPRYKAHIPCLRGFYQPDEGQTSCSVCTRGHSCKERGLSMQPACPAGFVCEVSQVGSEGKPCPFGHWCDEGTETFVQPIIKDQPSQLEELYRPTIVDGWNTQFIFAQDDRDRYKNKTIRINNTTFIVSNVTQGEDATEIDMLNMTDIDEFTPRWKGERSDIPYGLVHDYPQTTAISDINPSGDSHPIILTAQLSFVP